MSDKKGISALALAVVVAVLFSLCIGTCGCNEMQEIRGFVVELNNNVDHYQEKVEGEIDRVQKQLDEVSEAAARTEITGNEAVDALNSIRAANAASSGFNPWAGPIDAVIAALIALAGGAKVGALATAKNYEKSKRKWAESKLNGNS